jgi:arabinose-5-phosphate isomerase
MRSPSTAVRYAVSILKQEARAIQAIVPHIGKNFDTAVELCKNKPRIVVSGMGKSGIVAQKISSTFASLGMPSWYLDPALVAHGDLGRIAPDDQIILISNSGETHEIVFLATLLNRRNRVFIAITSKEDSSLAKLAYLVLATGPIEEAGALKMIPTSSTTAVMALGDALALACVGDKFTADDYRLTHPGGSIGHRLSKVDEVMRKGEDCPIVTEVATIPQTVMAITKAEAGAAIIVNEEGILSGIFTDGDLRRAVEANDFQGPIMSRMTHNPVTLKSGQLIDEAMSIFNNHSIGELPVVDINNKPIGMLSLKDIIAVSACNSPKPVDQLQPCPPRHPPSEA